MENTDCEYTGGKSENPRASMYKKCAIAAGILILLSVVAAVVIYVLNSQADDGVICGACERRKCCLENACICVPLTDRTNCKNQTDENYIYDENETDICYENYY